MKITVAKWYTPLDHGIDKVGIEPDVAVEFKKEDYEKRFDRQLDEAKTIAGKLLKSSRKDVIAEYAEKKEAEKTERQNVSTAS